MVFGGSRDFASGARSDLPLLAAALSPRTGIHRVPAALTPLRKAAPQSTIPSGQRAVKRALFDLAQGVHVGPDEPDDDCGGHIGKKETTR